ncbi:MAG TPA: flagellar FliJ family protein [Candidatus Acidoferrales bacterium]|nr:flagellar FliJ family protein [Candidatus Acidoferrales bacterium]
MPFHFPLSSLLRLRESLEKNELQRLQALAAQIAQVRAEIELLDTQIELSRREVLEQAAAGISGAELHIAALGEFARLELRAKLIVRRDELERTRQVQQARYAEARQRREILSNLQERQRSAYQHEQARREQQQLDELFLIRRSSKKRLGSNSRNGASP